MILKNDCPNEAQDDGRFTINDIRNVYVDYFDLKGKEQQTFNLTKVFKGRHKNSRKQVNHVSCTKYIYIGLSMVLANLRYKTISSCLDCTLPVQH